MTRFLILYNPQGRLRPWPLYQDQPSRPDLHPSNSWNRLDSAKPKRLLDVSDVAEWLGVSKGWVRDHASCRRQPRLFADKSCALKNSFAAVKPYLCRRSSDKPLIPRLPHPTEEPT